MSDGRQQRHTPDAALRIHVRVGKLVLKTQTEERASALNSCGSEEVSSVPLTSGAECASVLKLVLWLSTHLEVAGGGRKWRKCPARDESREASRRSGHESFLRLMKTKKTTLAQEFIQRIDPLRQEVGWVGKTGNVAEVNPSG